MFFFYSPTVKRARSGRCCWLGCPLRLQRVVHFPDRGGAAGPENAEDFELRRGRFLWRSLHRRRNSSYVSEEVIRNPFRAKSDAITNPCSGESRLNFSTRRRGYLFEPHLSGTV